jgi:chromosome segregation ATPase
MTKQTLRGTLAAGAILAPTLAFTQAPPTDSHQTNALINEVRLLRRAIERQSGMAARAQLLVGRLALQDQRLGRALATAERVETQATGRETHATTLSHEHAELRRLIDEATDPEVRAGAERQLRDWNRRMHEHGATAASFQSRLTEARHAVDVERARYEEIEAALSRLDRDLEVPVKD